MRARAISLRQEVSKKNETLNAGDVLVLLIKSGTSIRNNQAGNPAAIEGGGLGREFNPRGRQGIILSKKLGPGRLLRLARSQPGKGGQTPASKRIVRNCTYVAITLRNPTKPRSTEKYRLSPALFWRSDIASAERGNEMHFAVLANGIEHAASGDFTVDRHRDRRPDVSILK